MRRTLIIWGSVGAGVILILAMLTTVVSAQTIKSNEVRTNVIQYFKDKIHHNNLVQDGIIDIFFYFVFLFFLLLDAFLKGTFY